MIEGEWLPKLLSGASGSALSVWLAKITGWNRLVSFAGGVVGSQLFTPFAVEYFRLIKHENATAFTVGFLFMLLAKKLFEVVSGIDAKEIAAAFVARVRLALGVKKDD